MVTCITKGRMGNFLFIAIAAQAYALRYGLQFTPPEQSLAPQLWPVYLERLRKPFDHSLQAIYINDEGHRYRELPYSDEYRDKNIIIGTTDIRTGYFQSYKYSEGYTDQIRQLFGYSGETKKGWTALHVRRGDYLELQDRHPTVTTQYIEQALYLARKEFSARNIMVFSDDIDWCYETLKNLTISAHFFFSHSKSNDAEQDFYNMLTCEHQIVSNSSYSVVAALLNPNKNKVIICPAEDNYFGPLNKHLDVTDLYPPEWIRIKY